MEYRRRPLPGADHAAGPLRAYVVDGIDCVAVTAVFTVRLKLAVAVAPFTEVTVTV